MMKKKIDMLKDAYDALVKYIAKNGKTYNDKGNLLMYWDTHPVCFRDKCAEAIVYYNGKVMICDMAEPLPGFINLYAEEYGDKYVGMLDLPPKRTVEYTHVNQLLKDMMRYDKK